MTTYRDEVETLRAELQQTRAELAQMTAKFAKLNAKMHAQIEYRSHGGSFMHEWVTVVLVLLSITSILTLIVAILLERDIVAKSVMYSLFVLSTTTMVRIWWKAVPRVEVKK